MSIVTIVLIVVAVIALWVVYAYNRLITLKNRVAEAWSDIDVQLKRRFDLIPNLINTVKGYVAHESGTLERVVEARNSAMSATSRTEKGEANNILSESLKSIFALSESYPDLKANKNFLELQRELSDTENKIQSARRFYNGSVKDLNITLEIFPSNVIGSSFGFVKAEFFGLEDGSKEREVVEVKF